MVVQQRLLLIEYMQIDHEDLVGNSEASQLESEATLNDNFDLNAIGHKVDCGYTI